MEKKHIVFDMDDVLWGLNRKAAHLADVPYEKLTTFVTQNNPNLTEEEKARVLAVYSDPKTYEDIEFYEPIIALINHLHHDYPDCYVKIVSNNASEEIRNLKHKQLMSVIDLPECQVDFQLIDLINGAHKKKFPDGMFILVDDSPHNILTGNAVHKIMPAMPYNDLDQLGHIHRTKSQDELIELVLDLIKYGKKCEPQIKIITEETVWDYQISILNDMIAVCSACKNGKSFSGACAANGLNRTKTDRLLKAIGKYKDMETPLAEMELENTKDPCLSFYRAIFGESAMKAMALPPDCEETVGYVLEHAKLTDEQRYILMHRFGFQEEEQPQTYRKIAEGLCVSETRIPHKEAMALCKCRRYPFWNMLKLGLTAYEKEQKQKDEMQALKEQQAEELHEAQMKILAQHHALQIEALRKEYEQKKKNRKAAALCIADIRQTLEETPIKELQLGVRSGNALARSLYITNVLELIHRCTVEELLMIPHMGAQSVVEVIEKLNKYTKTHFDGMSAYDLRICLESEADK